VGGKRNGSSCQNNWTKPTSGPVIFGDAKRGNSALVLAALPAHNCLMKKSSIDLGTIFQMAFGVTLLGAIPTLALEWFGIWHHIPALLFGLLGAVVFFHQESPDSEFANTIRTENQSNALGFVLGAGLLVIFGLFIASDSKSPVVPEIQASSKSNEAIISPSLDEGNTKEIVKTNIDEILDTYERNQIEGLQKFGNSTIELSGEVVRVREALGTGILVLRSPDTGTQLEIGFSEKGTPKLGSLKAGDMVVVTCPGAYEASGLIILSDCSDVDIHGNI
jgi:hypothetical protein